MDETAQELRVARAELRAEKENSKWNATIAWMAALNGFLVGAATGLWFCILTGG